MSDGKLTLYLELEEAEQIFSCLKQREDLFRRESARSAKRLTAAKKRWNINSLPAGVQGLVEHSMSSKKESFAINQ